MSRRVASGGGLAGKRAGFAAFLRRARELLEREKAPSILAVSRGEAGERDEGAAVQARQRRGDGGVLDPAVATSGP